jgi:RNA polymerase sigma factor (TIGR02999 family)
MTENKTDLTHLLNEAAEVGPAEVARRLLPLVYDELRALAEKYLRGERKEHTLQPTALVHEAFMRLVDQSRVNWKGRTHFYAVSAEAMRRILIDNARAHRRLKRGGGWQRVVLDEGVALETGHLEAVALQDALEQLAHLDPEQARIVELRFFAGLTVDEVAEVLGVSKRKVEADWTHAKAWLRTALDPKSSP